jgi:hypothetical protein
VKKSLNPKQWRIATLQKELDNVNEILEKNAKFLEEPEIEYFEKYKETIITLITEECLLLGEDDE